MVQLSALCFETDLVNHATEVSIGLEKHELTWLVVINEASYLVDCPKVQAVQASVDVTRDLVRV